MSRTQLARAIIVARAKRGMTQRELAGAAGVTDRTVSAIERGVANPKPTTLAALAAVLELDAASLIFDNGDAA